MNERELNSVRKTIQSINSMAKVQQAVKGKVDLEYVLGVGGFDLERWVMAKPAFHLVNLILSVSCHLRFC